MGGKSFVFLEKSIVNKFVEIWKIFGEIVSISGFFMPATKVNGQWIGGE